jgi:acyl-CoA thioester hydrolase
MLPRKEEIPELLKAFKHISGGYVKFRDVDHFGVVYNLVYQEWTEIARVEFGRDTGISLLPSNLNNKVEPDFAIMLVHSEIDFYNSATFFENYVVYTRVSNVGRSSVTFEHIVVKDDGTPLCAQKVVHVYVDKDHNTIPVPDDIRRKISEYN